MNTVKLLAAMLLALVLPASCNGAKQQSSENMNKNSKSKGSKVLVVYFSHPGENYAVGNVKVGNTKLVADEIQKVTGADAFEVVAEKSYDMPYDALTELAKKETESGEKPAFKGGVQNIDQYDVVFVGGPIWWGTYPQVMFTFFDKYDLNGKTIIPFSTHEGSGLGSVVSDLKKLYPKATFKEAFSIYGHETRTDMSKVDKWLQTLDY